MQLETQRENVWSRIAMRSTITILALLPLGLIFRPQNGAASSALCSGPRLIIVYIFAVLFTELLAGNPLGYGWFESVPQANGFL